jgi:hypothetical protein
MKLITTNRLRMSALFLSCLAANQTHAQWAARVWTNYYNGPSNSSDVANAVAVDNARNVFVTGYTYNGGYNYATIAYSAAGAPLWTNLFSAGQGDDEAIAIATDLNGNVFVTGQSKNVLGPYDFATIAYSGAGVPLWNNRFNPNFNFTYAVPSAIATDTNGNVFVTGYAYNTDGSGSYYATIAYSGAGGLLWSNRFSGSQTNDSATGLAIDANGNVLVTGLSGDGGSGRFDYATVKYSNAGVGLWTNRYSGPTNGDDRASAVAVDRAGNVFVTGRSSGTNGLYEYATVGYSAAGSALWTNRYGSPPDRDQAAAIAVDASGNVFVSGTALGFTYAVASVTLAYSSAGQPLWTNRYAGPHNVKAIVLDGNGNVFVTSTDFLTVAYSGGGALLWTNQYAGTGFSTANGLAADSNGNLTVTGSSPGANFAADYATIKYAPTALPYLTVQGINDKVVVLWTNSLFGLQSAPTAAGTFTNITGATSPYTNSIAQPYRFLRLSLY